MQNSSSFNDEGPLIVGDRIVLRDLKSSSLNGGTGSIVEVCADGRYQVHLDEANISIPLNKENVSLQVAINWKCDYCAAGFATIDEAASHEAKCMQRGIIDEQRIKKQQSEAQQAKKLKRKEEGSRLQLKADARRNDMLALFGIATEILEMTEQGILRNFSAENQHTLKTNGLYYWEMRKCQLIRCLQYKIPAIAIGIRTVSEGFSAFVSAPHHHPYRQHEKTLLNIAKKLEHTASECHPLCIAIPEYPTESVPVEVTTVFQHILQSTFPSLRELAKTIQGLIEFPEHSGNSKSLYSKRHAVKAVLKHPKGSRDRGNTVQDMVHMGFVPCQSSLYRAIKDVENEGNTIIDSKWPTGGYVPKHTVLYIKKYREWKPKIFFPVIPVDCDGKGKPILDKNCVQRLFCPPSTSASLNCYIGQNKSEKYWGGRLYFSPKQFPTPVNLQDVGKPSDKTFKKLKKYILQWCEDAKTPVICNGGKPGSKKFVCSKKRKAQNLMRMRARGAGEFSQELLKCSLCEFRLTVKWDRIGYYIPLYNHKQDCYVSWLNHNHEIS